MKKKAGKKIQKKVQNAIDALFDSLKTKKNKKTSRRKTKKDEFNFIYTTLNEVDANPQVVYSMYGGSTPTPTTCGGCSTGMGCTNTMEMCE